jgi:hypothetical protein
MDELWIAKVSEELRRRDPGRYAQTQVALEKLSTKSIDDLEPMTAAAVIVALAEEDMLGGEE